MQSIRQLLYRSINYEKLLKSTLVKPSQPQRFLHKTIYNIQHKHLIIVKISNNLEDLINYLQFIIKKSMKNKEIGSNKRSNSSKDLRSYTINSSDYNGLIQEIL